MKVIYKAPGCAPEPRDIPNTMEELQATVGGYIETVTFATDAVVICNEEGRLCRGSLTTAPSWVSISSARS